MRLIGAASVLFVLTLSFAISSGSAPAARQQDGLKVFRYDTFGDEQLWTDTLRMHEGLKPVSPALALKVGLKVDVEALPAPVVEALKAKKVDLSSPAVTLDLLKVNAVVGVIGKVSDAGQLTSIGITCALCHSTVDNSFAPGIGRRLDGWPNVDLNVGAILGLSPALDDKLKAEFAKWGPGKYDPRHHAFDGKQIVPLKSPSIPVVIPPAYGLRDVGFETFTGDGPISYWNAYVGISQMGGRGNFKDPRIGLDDLADAGPRDSEAGSAPRVSAESGGSETSERKYQQGSCGPRRTSVQERSWLREVSYTADVHRRTDWRRQEGPGSARSGGRRRRPALRGPQRDAKVSGDAPARFMAAPPVFPRWQRRRSHGCRQSLRDATWTETHSGSEGRPG